MNHRFLRVLLAGLVLLFLASQSAFADNVYATIRGTVTDPSGAVVQGATVTATNADTHVDYTTTSRDSGNYEFLQLPVGTYTVSVSKQGFKNFKSVGVPLKVNDIYELPVKLSVGTASETVEVKANAVQVETTDMQQKTVIGGNEIVDMPLNGRNFVQLSQLSPGVMASSDRFTSNFSTNGSQTQQSAYLINGTDTNDIALNTPGLLPSPDAIQEFNLITSTINPEYARNSGGIVNAVIKNGTNQWHGGIFDFYRDTFLNAHNFFTPTIQPVFHQNQFGGTFGGPIHKDKTFFFLSYQGTYNRAAALPVSVTTLNSAQRAGNFQGDSASLISNFLNNGTAQTPFAMAGDDGVVHPAGTNFFGTTNSGAIFNCGNAPTKANPTCSNPAFGILGTSGFNSIATSLTNQFVPLPNLSGNIFSWSPITDSKTDQGIARIDHNFNASNTLWGLFAISNNRSTQQEPFTGATVPGFGTFSTSKIYNITTSYTHTFSSTALNEIRLGWYKLNFDAVEPSTTVAPSSFGFNIISNNPAANQLPVISLADAGGFSLGFSDNGPQPRKDSNYQLTDNFTKVSGKHTFKFGFQGERFQVDNPFFFLINGHYTYGSGGGQFSTGDAFADFLLGVPDQYVQGSGAVINARAYEYYTYGQDQWKIKNNLTITYGAGYQIDTPYNNNQYGGKAFNCLTPGRQSSVFSPQGPDPITGNPTGAPVGMTFPGDPGCTNSGTYIKYGHIGPRFGFAYSPQWGGRITNGQANKTSIRGGFGVYFNRYEEETALQNLAAPPFGLTSFGIGDVGLSPSFANPWSDVSGAGSSPNKFPFVAPNPGAPVDFNFFEPLGLNTSSPTLSTPYAMNFNLNIQREFPANTVVSLGYVGSLGRHLYRAYDQDPMTLQGAQNCLTQTFGGPFTCVALRNAQHFFFPQNTVLGANTAQCVNANPFTGLPSGACFGSWGTQFTDGTSNYNALQANVTKGLTHGLQLIASYTWSHAIDNGSGFENSGFGARGTNPYSQFSFLNIGDSGFDARQRLVLGYIYGIPSFFSHSNWADRLIGGWKLSGISTFQSGFPFNLSDTGFRSLTCDGFSFYGCPDNPNQVAGVTTLDPRTSKFGTKNDYWFNPADFKRQTIGTFGNTGRDSIHGPGILNTDLALLKDTKIREGKNLELGIEAFNIFNHTQFANPSGNIASSNFGRVLSTQIAPRIVQLRAKFNF